MSDKFAQVLIFFLLSLFVFALSVCTAAPMGDFLQESDDLASRDSENMMLSPSYREEILRNFISDQSAENENAPYNKESIKRSGFRNLISAAKRMGLGRSNRGGVALCLWKVCPAGPWLSRQ